MVIVKYDAPAFSLFKFCATFYFCKYQHIYRVKTNEQDYNVIKSIKLTAHFESIMSERQKFKGN